MPTKLSCAQFFCNSTLFPVDELTSRCRRNGYEHSRKLIVVLLLGLAAPIGLGGLVLPAYAQENDGDSQGDYASDQTDQTMTENTAEAPDDSAPANPQSDVDFSNLDVGEPNGGQQLYGVRSMMK